MISELLNNTNINYIYRLAPQWWQKADFINNLICNQYDSIHETL